MEYRVNSAGATPEIDHDSLLRHLVPVTCEIDKKGIVWKKTRDDWVPFCAPSVAAGLVADNPSHPASYPTTDVFRNKKDGSVWAVHTAHDAPDEQRLLEQHPLSYYKTICEQLNLVDQSEARNFLGIMAKNAPQITWSPTQTHEVKSRQRKKLMTRVVGAIFVALGVAGALTTCSTQSASRVSEPLPSATVPYAPTPNETSPIQAPEISPEPAENTITAVSYNVYYKNLKHYTDKETPAEFDAKVDKVVTHLQSLNAGILGLQEVIDAEGRGALYDKMIACAGCKYDGYMPERDKTDQAGGKTPILWLRDTFELVEGSDNHGYKSVHMQSTKDEQVRAFSYVKLRHLESGEEFWVSNAHFPHAVEKADGQLKGTAKRQNDYERLMKKFSTFARSKKGEKHITMGDLNVGAKAQRIHCTAEPDNAKLCVPYFPYKQFENLNIKTIYDIPNSPIQPTLGDRAVDYIGVNSVPSLQIKSVQQRLPKGRSDHNPVGAEILLTNE